jgi:4-oxalocrotonate tautomerase
LHLQFLQVGSIKEGLMPEIVVHALDGRSVEQKRALIKELTEAVVRNYNVDASTVTINIVESARTNKARGGVLFSDMAAKACPSPGQRRDAPLPGSTKLEEYIPGYDAP